MKINEYFESEYLTVGKTYDNYVFINYPKEFLSMAKEKLSVRDNGVKPCNVTITRELEEKFEKFLENAKDEKQKNRMAEKFICSLVLKEILIGESIEHRNRLWFANEIIESVKENDFFRYNKQRMEFVFYDCANYWQRYVGKIELNFFLKDTQNTLLQRALNGFLGRRDPFSIKVFTNNERLPSYRDICGTIVEYTHDYRQINMNNFIENEEEKEQ